MTAALALRDAIVAGIRAYFDTRSVPTVEVYDGPADDAFLKKYSVAVPAIVVTVLGGDYIPRGGTIVDELAIGAYVITKSTSAVKRADANLLLRERLARLVFHGEWTVAYPYKAPSRIESANLSADILENMNMAIWSMSWKHDLHVPGMTDDEYAALDAFAELFAKYYEPDADPEVDAPLAEQLIVPEQ